MRSINPYFSNISFSDSIGLILAAFVELIKIRRGNSKYFQYIFEAQFKEITGLDGLQSVPSNRSGIYLLLTALGIGKGDEVILTGYTCSAVTEPIVELGAVPIYADITADNYCLNIAGLEKLISSKTRVIIAQHTYGISAPILEIVKVAEKHQIFLIEDCALALGSKLNGSWLGTYGDAGIWSFELSKTISVGWGGIIGVRSNAELSKKITKLIDLNGNQPRFLAAQRLIQAGISGLLYRANTPFILRHYFIGLLFKIGLFRSSKNTPAHDLRMPSDFQWRFLTNQLNSLDKILERHKLAASEYLNVLKEFIEVPASIRNSNLIRFPLMVKNREKLIHYFAQKDIEIGRWFDSPVSGGKLPNIGYVRGSCPVSEYVTEHIVNLPLHARLTRPQIKNIAECLREYFKNYPEELKVVVVDFRAIIKSETQ